MIKKSYKWLNLLLVSILILSCIFLLIGCRSKGDTNQNTAPKENLFLEIKEYILNKGSTEPSGEYIYLLEENEQDSSALFVTFDPRQNTLSLGGENADFREYAITIPYFANYTNLDSYAVSANAIQTHAVTATVNLPTVDFTDINNTTVLPELEFKHQTDGETVTDEVKTTIRAKLTTTLNTTFTKFNQFYLEKIKNNDKNYNYAIYKYFRLPILQV